jgi:hypothetical protein
MHRTAHSPSLGIYLGLFAVCVPFVALTWTLS